MNWALGQQYFAVAFNDGGNNIEFFIIVVKVVIPAGKRRAIPALRLIRKRNQTRNVAQTGAWSEGFSILRMS